MRLLSRKSIVAIIAVCALVAAHDTVSARLVALAYLGLQGTLDHVAARRGAPDPAP